MATESIEKLAAELAGSFEKVEQRRQSWQTATKPLLMNKLQEITEKIKLDWSVNLNDMLVNLESVFISFNPIPSGIMEKSPINVINKMQIGGFLSFSQTRNGQIVAWISMPLIEGLEEGPAQNQTLETLEPEEIDDQTINNHVEKFLDEILQWLNENRDEIGFARHLKP
ncbi:hypothetical protein [Chitinophaga caeni]|nr:hypothetical protein [Chitinophaga caeni]